jgi:hypothetical protein
MNIEIGNSVSFRINSPDGYFLRNQKGKVKRILEKGGKISSLWVTLDNQKDTHIWCFPEDLNLPKGK